MSQKITLALSRLPLALTLPPSASVQTAAKLMTQHNVGAVMVVEKAKLIGIFTERDMVNRVVAEGLGPEKTPLQRVMTRNPITLEIGESVTTALEIMNKFSFRHLPLLDRGQLVGMISIRDLFSAVHEELKSDIEQKQAFIFGEVYGMAA